MTKEKPSKAPRLATNDEGNRVIDLDQQGYADWVRVYGGRKTGAVTPKSPLGAMKRWRSLRDETNRE
ncbi:MAG TPA: hypothetical protein VGF34_14280 [Stellaceae bacterium]|jgi:hypothetical protein